MTAAVVIVRSTEPAIATAEVGSVACSASTVAQIAAITRIADSA